MTENSIREFIAYCKKHIKGDEKGEAQTFLDRFFVALGYNDGYKGAGANCEYRIRNETKRTTSFADLVWKPRVLIEMKKRGENLEMHLQQATSYWMQLVPDRPQYVILCNFDEFWIYDFNKDVYKPKVIVPLAKLDEYRLSFTFLLSRPTEPLFEREHVDITAQAAEKIASAYKSMVKRKAAKPEVALRYILQCIISMFAQDVGLLPDKIFTRIAEECEKAINDLRFDEYKVPVSYDLIGGLFRAMNDEGITPAGKYKGVEYFNGGLFSDVQAIELTNQEVHMLHEAATKDWKHVNPSIFGTIFEQALEDENGNERHRLGAHYTHEVDIKKIVDPVIVQPWMERIEAAETLDEHLSLLTELSEFKVLDSACGSGNFLFIAFKEMKLLERKLLGRIRDKYGKPTDATKFKKFLLTYQYVNTRQFYGYDIKPFAVELAKVTLMVAKELSILDKQEVYDNKNNPLPLDNLDKNIICCDALLDDKGNARKWVEADAIIGNPPYQSKNKMQEEFGVVYMKKLRTAYPDVPGRADFCVYWFYKAHQTLKENAYAGLVGTNTIRQNYSREGSLDYITNNGGYIFNAVASEPWSGAAAVYVSIVSWKKGIYNHKSVLYTSDEKGNLAFNELPKINSSLTLNVDVVTAHELLCNIVPKKVHQGQTHGHEGFLLSKSEGLKLIKANKKNLNVLKPFLTGDEMLTNYQSQPSRFVIDFSKMDQLEASSYSGIFNKIKNLVLPDIEKKAQLEIEGKIKANGHEAWLNMWWKMWRRREDMLNEKSKLNRFIAWSRVSQRPIYEFITSDINPNDALMVAMFEDDYSFGIIQSNFHWEWWKAKCSTLGNTFRYTANTVWDTFPWPQQPTVKQITNVAFASKALRNARNKAVTDYHISLRDLYRILEQPGRNPIKDLQTALDRAVAEAYGYTGGTSDVDAVLSFLLDLNKKVHEAEETELPVTAPGLPKWVKDKTMYVTDDCVRFEW
jgi:SAM-dependent methyltransferase